MEITQARSAPSPRPGRLFHTFAAVLLIALVVTGFHRFYFEGRAYPGRELTPPIRNLIILHGVAMTAWMLVFLAQPLLILSGKRQVHARVGSIAAVLAAAIVVLGLKLGVESARFKPPGMVAHGLYPRQFMAIPVLSVLIFAGFVGAGVLYRRRPAVHRIMMLLGTLAAISAAVARIDTLSRLYAGTVWDRIWGPLFMTVVVAVFLLVFKWLLTRSLDRIYALGCVGLALALAAIIHVATTPTWDSVASALLRWTA
jgi:hypothetical protein